MGRDGVNGKVSECGGGGGEGVGVWERGRGVGGVVPPTSHVPPGLLALNLCADPLPPTPI